MSYIQKGARGRQKSGLVAKVLSGLGSLASGPRGPRVSLTALSDDPVPSVTAMTSPTTGTLLDPGAWAANRGPVWGAVAGIPPVVLVGGAALVGYMLFVRK